MNGFSKISKMIKKQNTTTLLLCLAGIALNLILNVIVKAFKLPIYLDTVGTVAVAAMGGYLPGVVVGIITNLIKCVFDQSSIYYGVLNELIAVCTAYMVHRDWFRKLWGKIVAVVIFTMIGGGIGSGITWFLEGVSFDGEELRAILYGTGYFSNTVSHMLSGIILDLPDKVITVLLATVVIKAVPERFYRYFRFSLWMQNPTLSDIEKGQVTGRSKIRGLSIRIKVMIALIVSLTAIVALGVGIGMRAHHEDMVKERAEYARIIISRTGGKDAASVIAEINPKHMTAGEKSFLVKMVTACSGILILLCSFVLWLVDYHFVFPVRSITNNMDSFSFKEESQSVLDEQVKEIRSIDVRTGDELESLYYSLCRMMLNQTEQMRSIRRLSDSTAKMQDGLIITMADLVESRDSDTGAHVQKTAAYVKLIVEGLKKKGYYAGKLTPKFMSDVVRSAPLHDVGKINIPDKVLNKPGKLTDEEYAIMKTHTVAGKRIIENAISTVEGDNYLKEARNMAAYHHERWDGKGYPEGIHGEVIPLSARIMAVADVFDALTSPRVYKPAFPLEKALAILEEGKGTQFDPKCVEVFMEALPEVKVILRKYNKDV